MKKYLLVLGGSLALAVASAMAAPVPQPVGEHQNSHHRQSDHGDRHHHDDQRYDRHDRRSHRGKHDKHGHGTYGMHDRGRHEGWYKRGGHMPEEYRSYYVTDYHVYHLEQPLRGYRWVRSDNGDFLMIAIATGIIADILIGN